MIDCCADDRVGGDISDQFSPVIDLAAVFHRFFVLFWCAQAHGILLMQKSGVSIAFSLQVCPRPCKTARSPLLDHHLHLNNEIIAVAQETDAIKLSVDVVVLDNETERVTGKGNARLDKPGALPVVQKH